MPIQIIKQDLEIPFIDFNLSDKFWKTISAPVEEQHGTNVVTDPVLVQEALKNSYRVCGELFMQILGNETRASFYLYVQHLLENTFEIYKDILGGKAVPVNKSDFANVRRTLRIILEQSTKLELSGAPNFATEISLHLAEYIATLDDLLYIGYQAFLISQEIARSQLFPKSTSIDVDDEGLLAMTARKPYDVLFNYLEKDISKHDESVKLYHNMTELIAIWNELGVDYGELTSFMGQQIGRPEFRLSVLPKDEYFKEVREKFSPAGDLAINFYDGLMVTKQNVLDFEDCILRSQDIRRIIYRPLVEVSIDGVSYIMAGLNRWLESLTTLTTNALPWGHVADEWKQHKKIKDFVQYLESTHDNILEDAAVSLLHAEGIVNDKGVKSLRQHKGNNHNIEKIAGVGEIDMIFLDQPKKILYVVECKHNKSRFDYFNWKRDYSGFKNKYETQLGNKIKFVKANTEMVLTHLEVIGGISIEAKESYSVEGIFLINAPTLYMYDAVYPTLTLHNLKDLLKGSYVIPKFLIEMEDGKEILVEQPYFQNVSKLVD